MKTIIQRVDLDRAIKAVFRAVPTRGPLPILCNVKVKAAGKAITITGTDLEMSITATAGADVSQDGETLIPAKTLADIVAKLPEGAVTVETDGDDTHIRAGRSKFKLRASSAADFPEPPRANDEADRIVFDAQSLVAAMKHVAFASAPEDKAVICGVYFEQNADGITIAATDGFRLSQFKIPGIGGEPWSIVVPRRAVDEMGRQLAGVDGEIAIYRAGQQLIIEAGSRQVTTRLIDGVFPRYQAIIPTGSDRSVVVNRLSLLEAVERIAVLANDREASMVKFAISDGEVAISAGSSDAGSADESIGATLTGDPTSFWLNADLLTQLLKAAAGESLVMKMTKPLMPVTFEVDGRSDWIGLVMPMNRA